METRALLPTMASQATLVRSVAPGVACPMRPDESEPATLKYRNVAQRIHGSYIPEHPFRHQLRSAVGVDGTRGRFLARVAFLGHPVHGCGGGKDHVLDAIVETRLQQGPRGAGVVPVILERQSDRFGHDGMRREMHDRIDLVLRQELRHQRLVAYLAHHQLAGGHRLAKALAEIVGPAHAPPRLAQLPNDMTADIAGSAGDEDTGL